ncbi:MAG: hypothetical protein AAF346_15155 [Pseudomonadota bacterium]
MTKSDKGNGLTGGGYQPTLKNVPDAAILPGEDLNGEKVSGNPNAIASVPLLEVFAAENARPVDRWAAS